MASSGSASSHSDGEATALNLLATTDDEERRIELLKKHDTLKTRMEQLRRERTEQNKKKKQLTAALRLAQRRKKRIVGKACSLSDTDIVQILCLKNEQKGKKEAKLAAANKHQEE